MLLALTCWHMFSLVIPLAVHELLTQLDALDGISNDAYGRQSLREIKSVCASRETTRVPRKVHLTHPGGGRDVGCYVLMECLQKPVGLMRQLPGLRYFQGLKSGKTTKAERPPTAEALFSILLVDHILAFLLGGNVAPTVHYGEVLQTANLEFLVGGMHFLGKKLGQWDWNRFHVSNHQEAYGILKKVGDSAGIDTTDFRPTATSNK